MYIGHNVTAKVELKMELNKFQEIVAVTALLAAVSYDELVARQPAISKYVTRDIYDSIIGSAVRLGCDAGFMNADLEVTPIRTLSAPKIGMFEITFTGE